MSLDDSLLVSPGELRPALLQLLDALELPMRILVSAPGLMTTPWPGYADVAREPHRGMSMRMYGQHRDALLREFEEAIDSLPQTHAWFAILQRWLHRLGDERVFVRHARALTFTRLLSRPDESLLPMTPLTPELFGQDAGREFSLALTDVLHDRARSWFARRWSECAQPEADITAEVYCAIADSWAGTLLDPEDIYYKVVSEYFATALESVDEEADDNPMLSVMTEFQNAAYQQAKGIIRRYGGVYLADVVGLGKTFIGLALLRYYQDQFREHAVVVAPPVVCESWDALAAEHRIELVTVSHGKLSDLEKYRTRELLVIDESHNFRNENTNRFETMLRWLHGEGAPIDRRVILISATPQNNRPRDVFNQLRLFPHSYNPLPHTSESLEQFFKDVREGRRSLRSLLQHILVRRTRRQIQREYPNETITVRRPDGTLEEQPIVFPNRISGELRYSIEAVYRGDLYEEIIGVLRDMSYALYGLGHYVLLEHEDDPRLQGLYAAGRGLRGLIKVLLLKRLESSLHAFKISVGRLRDRLRDALDRLQQQGCVRIRMSTVNVQGDADQDEMVANDEVVDVDAHCFDVAALTQDLEHDRASIESIAARIATLELRSDDAKRLRLEEHFRDRPPRSHRTIIFTQFADTGQHLREMLADRFGRTAFVSGSTGNARSVARRFAPRGARAADVEPEDEVDLLIATDALSEGVNLQDADTLINYDLHWNPVRLIQRAGRIDRIGSPNESIHVLSFLPERGLEERLGVEAVVRQRMQEIISVFGADQRELPSLPADDQPDVEGAVEAFSGQALEGAEDDDLDSLSDHIERILHLRRHSPDRYDQIRQLRPGRRGLSNADLPGVTATRLAWYWSFWQRDEEGVDRLDDRDGLDLMWAHANAGRSELDDRARMLRMHRTLGEFVENARAHFEEEARTFRAQRSHPRLTPSERSLIARLEAHREEVVEARRALVDRMIRWVELGQFRKPLRDAMRQWNREELTMPAIFTEMRGLLRRFEVQEEALGDEETVGTVLGTRDESNGVGASRGDGEASTSSTTGLS